MTPGKRKKKNIKFMFRRAGCSLWRAGNVF
jgi:hypothetical protein